MAFRGGGGGGGAVTFAPPAGQIDVGDATAEGGSGSAPRADHQHAYPGPTGPPGAVAAAGVAGGSNRPARQDHTHTHTAGAHRSGGHADLSSDFAALAHGHPDVADHEALANPHPGYLEPAEHDALDHSPAAGSIALSELGDVGAAPADGQVYQFNAATGLFEPTDLPASGTSDHGALAGLADHEDHPQYAMVRLAEVVLAAPAASIVLSAIPATFKHLELIYSLRADGGSSVTQLYLRLNGDATGAYKWQRAISGGTDGNGSAQAQIDLGRVPGPTAFADQFGTGHIVLPDYAGAARKTVHSHVGLFPNDAATSGDRYELFGMWGSVAVIDSITLLPGSGNFIAGGSVSLYGVRAGG